MRKRTLLSGLTSLGLLPLAGCSSSSDDENMSSSTPKTTPSPNPTSTPDTPPKLKSLTVSQVRIYTKLNPLHVHIDYAHLVNERNYTIEFVTESDAGARSITHSIPQVQGMYPGITGFRADAPEGTATDGSATLSYTAILREEGTKKDSEEGIILSYE